MGGTDGSAARRDQYHYGDLAKALKDAALAMIAADGVARFSLRDAASRLGVAPSAAYRHFADKSELLAAVALDGFAALGARWQALMAAQQAIAGADPAALALARFSAGADAYFYFAKENPALFELMYGPFGTGERGRCRLDETEASDPYAMLARALDDLCATNIITAAARAGAEVKAYAAIHGISCLVVAGVFRDFSDAQVAAQLTLVKDHILAGLLAGPKESWTLPCG